MTPFSFKKKCYICHNIYKMITITILFFTAYILISFFLGNGIYYTPLNSPSCAIAQVIVL
mgnify:CR=1 FL=1